MIFLDKLSEEWGKNYIMNSLDVWIQYNRGESSKRTPSAQRTFHDSVGFVNAHNETEIFNEKNLHTQRKTSVKIRLHTIGIRVSIDCVFIFSKLMGTSVWMWKLATFICYTNTNAMDVILFTIERVDRMFVCQIPLETFVYVLYTFSIRRFKRKLIDVTLCTTIHVFM